MRFLKLTLSGAIAACAVALAGASINLAADEGSLPNLLEGAIVKNTSQTPYEAGWRYDGCSADNFKNNDGGSNGYRHNMNLTSNDGPSSATVFNVVSQNVKYAYPVTPEVMKVYELRGNLWRRNGGDTEITYKFYFADNIKGENPVAQTSLKFNKNNKCIKLDNYKLRLCTAEAYENMYFLWEATGTTNWQNGGLVDDVTLVPIGDAASISFVTDCDESTAPIYFLDGEEYKLTAAPAIKNPGYKLVGWFTDGAFTQPVTFPLTVTTNTVLYAKWEADTEKDLMAGWNGNGSGTSELPDAFGWEATPEVTWQASFTGPTYANGYRDDINVDGDAKTRVLIKCQNSSVFSFPVSGLKKDKIYRFKAKGSYMNHPATNTFDINSEKDGQGTSYGSTKLTTAKWGAYGEASMLFEMPEDASTAYMCWTVDETKDRALTWGYSLVEATGVKRVSFIYNGSRIAPSQLFESDSYTVTEPEAPEIEGMDFVGWYTDKDYTSGFDFAKPVSKDTEIYARYIEQGSTGELTDQTIAVSTSLPSLIFKNAKLTGDARLHLTSARPFIGGSKIDLAGDANWLYLENVKPSVAMQTMFDAITVGGRKINSEFDRISIYANGVVIIPNGKSTIPMTIYNGENLSGESMDCLQEVFYRGKESADDLGETQLLGDKFDNRIRSFVLRQGYMCVLANNPDGTGYSRVYIADDADMTVGSIPEELQFASFVRVSRWEWVSKKGICNGGLAAITNSSWYYDWSSGGNSMDPDFEYVMIRQNLSWPGWSDIATKPNTSHVNGINEPDHADQSNATVAQAISRWPEMFRTGRRLGSPTPDSFGKAWLNNFMAIADSLNYRVDYVVYHMYWDGRNGSSLQGSIKSAYDRFNRPVWITEWNNGANWTSENWPDQTGPKCDADCNPILDENGQTTQVTRPNTEANSKKQSSWLKDVLPAFDQSPYLERHAFYNWVQDARAVVLDNRLTPAGKVFAEHKAAQAFNRAAEHVHQWKIAPAWIETAIADDLSTITLSWYDHNGETGKNYTVERKLDNGEWEVFRTITAGTDYAYGATVSMTDNLTAESRQLYRLKALSFKDTESIYSREVGIVRDDVPEAPQVTATAVSSSIIDLSWNAVDGARGYRIERALTPQDAEAEPEYEVICKSTDKTSFRDTELQGATSYTYRVSSLSTALETKSAVVVISTKAVSAPESVNDFFVSAGDRCNILSWEHIYDATVTVYRSDKENGTFTVAAADIDGDRWTDTDVENGKTYFYKLTAGNKAGTSAETEVLSASPATGRHLCLNFKENNTLKDVWGAYHATLANGATVIDGRDEGDKAIQLSKNDKSHIVVGANAVAALDNDFTIATWIKYGASKGRIFDFGTGTGSFMMAQPSGNDKVRFKITCPDGTFDYTFTHPEINPDEWNHIVLMKQGDEMMLYVNGEFASSSKDKTRDNTDAIPLSPASLGNTDKNYLGRSQWPNDPYTSHAYSEFSIFNKSLSASQVKSLYDGEDVTTGIGSVKAEKDEMNVWTSNGTLIIDAPEATTVFIYAVDGTTVRVVKVDAGVNRINGLARGFYIVNANKVVL